MQFRTDCNQTTSSKWDNAYEQHEDDWDQKAEDNGTGMNRKKRRGRNTASVSKDAAIDTDNTHAKTIGDVKLTSELGADFSGTNGKQPAENDSTADKNAEIKQKTSGNDTETNQQAHCIATCWFTVI